MPDTLLEEIAEWRKRQWWDTGSEMTETESLLCRAEEALRQARATLAACKRYRNSPDSIVRVVDAALTRWKGGAP